MRKTILFALSLCFLSVAYSKPVERDSKSLQSTGRTRENSFDVHTEALVASNIMESVRGAEVVPRLDSGPFLDAGKLRRSKRQVIRARHDCARGRIWFMKRCMSFEKYERLVKENDEEK